MMKAYKLMVVLALLLIPAVAFGVFEAKSILQTTVDGPVLDTAAGGDEDLLFLLTKGSVIIYSVSEETVLDRIALKEAYDRIDILDDERLVVTDSATSRVNVVRFNRIYDIDLTGHTLKGPADAPVTLVVFDDYQCPYCARLEKFIEETLAQFPTEVNYAIKFYPLASHPFSQQAAMAALAADRQGKFWEFHSRLLENFNQMSEEKITEIATELGLDMERFKKDRLRPESQAMIQADLQNGKAVGVTGTPSVFINGKRIANRNLSSLPELIIRELGS